ncbi:hypothetical protein QX204_22480 [Nocardia sp. PE-7]|uniref:hypothetical protein n=1 Tax=Nocardia sp. PE-7 TaxID=3058426 RepID=UPI00265982B6|nr:hypothetical protein [Nocardia sp. PE-7]WKG07836.1 hypothetical protein QX204_22480 [Nocardia sp. PE-7]
MENSLETASHLIDVEAMEVSGVYKGPWDRDYLLDRLDRYAELYRLVAELDECVLVTFD